MINSFNMRRRSQKTGATMQYVNQLTTDFSDLSSHHDFNAWLRSSIHRSFSTNSNGTGRRLMDIVNQLIRQSSKSETPSSSPSSLNRSSGHHDADPYNLMTHWDDDEADRSTKTLVKSTNSETASGSYEKTAGSLTHFGASGGVKMVNVGAKPITTRTASAAAMIFLPVEVTNALTQDGKTHKGDVSTTAQLAGIMAAKQTSNLIPLCHNIPLTKVHVSIDIIAPQNVIEVTSHVQCIGRTGVEMEALMAVSVASLCVYDFCKSLSKDIVIGEIRLLNKTGGTSGQRADDPSRLLHDSFQLD